MKSKSKYALFILFVLFCLSANSQSKNIHSLDLHTKYATKVKTFYSTKNRKKNNLKAKYYWTTNREIHQSNGSYSGYLIHGTYNEFYLTNQLFAQGTFEYGLKSGRWIYWHSNGQIKIIEHYKNGLLHGEYLEYDQNAKLIYSGKFKNGFKNGVFIKTINDTLEYKEHYKKGFLKKEKKKIQDLKIKRKSNKKEKKKEKENKDEKPPFLDKIKSVLNKKTRSDEN